MFVALQHIACLSLLYLSNCEYRARALLGPSSTTSLTNIAGALRPPGVAVSDDRILLVCAAPLLACQYLFYSLPTCRLTLIGIE